MKKIVIVFLLISIPALLVICWIVINIRPVSTQSVETLFTIKSGSTATQVGRELFEKGLVRNPDLFRAYVTLTGKAPNIQAGTYLLSPAYNLFQIVNHLDTPTQVMITIPEGFSRKQIAERFAKSLNKNTSFVNEFMQLSLDDEGYLFPDTYSFSQSASSSAIISTMKENFNQKTDGLKLTRDQLILASIIEEETKSLEERPIVAGILTNRLRIGMALQVDVAPDTYKTTGLPPAPIANPGIASIKAAINPATTEYWYYLHDPSGQIHYAKTLDEQNANIDRYLR